MLCHKSNLLNAVFSELSLGYSRCWFSRWPPYPICCCKPYSKLSTNASHEAAMRFSATPTVFHERSPLLVSMWTRGAGGGGAFAVEKAHFVINQMERFHRWVKVSYAVHATAYFSNTPARNVVPAPGCCGVTKYPSFTVAGSAKQSLSHGMYSSRWQAACAMESCK